MHHQRQAADRRSLSSPNKGRSSGSSGERATKKQLRNALRAGEGEIVKRMLLALDEPRAAPSRWIDSRCKPTDTSIPALHTSPSSSLPVSTSLSSSSPPSWCSFPHSENNNLHTCCRRRERGELSGRTPDLCDCRDPYPCPLLPLANGLLMEICAVHANEIRTWLHHRLYHHVLKPLVSSFIPASLSSLPLAFSTPPCSCLSPVNFLHAGEERREAESGRSTEEVLERDKRDGKSAGGENTMMESRARECIRHGDSLGDRTMGTVQDDSCKHVVLEQMVALLFLRFRSSHSWRGLDEQGQPNSA